MRRNLLLAVLAVVAITVLWFFFVYRPAGNRIGDLENELQTAQDEELALIATRNALEELREGAAGYEAAVLELAAAIPPTANEASLIESLNRVALDNGMEVSSLTLTPPQGAGEGLASIPVSMQLTGTYFNLLGFLNDLENLDRLVRINQLSLSAVTEGSVTTLNVSVAGQAFSRTSLTSPNAAPPPAEAGEPPPDEGEPSPEEESDE